MILRPYQQAALDATWDFLRNREGNPALVLPTGAGKSPLMAAIASEAVQAWGGRVGILAHVQELVQQNADKLRTYWPGAPMGIYSASLRRRDRFEPILFCQIQSVANRATQLGHFDLLLIDEAHRIPLRGEGRYRKFIDDARETNPNLRVVGLTATPYRLQGRAVPVCGDGYVLNEVAYEARIPDLIRDGYLSPLVTRAGELPDLSGVKLRGGEYVEADLGRAMLAEGLVERTVADMLTRAHDRRAGIVFCVNVAHAEAVLAVLQASGERAALVHGETPKAEREALVASFQAGAIRWMVNVNVLSEGFDAPHIDCVAMLRPTKSPGMFYQQVGRGFRLAPNKENCLVLDYAGNVLEHGPVDQIKVRPARVGGPAEVQTMQAKECPKCQALLAIGHRECPECGHVFSTAEPEHLDRPVGAPVLSTEQERVVNRHTVTGISYARHEKPGKPPSLRVTYRCGLRTFREWVCLEHGGHARARALQWWATRAGAGNVPRTVDEALEAAWSLPRPEVIVVDETAKFPEVLEHVFGEAAGEPGALAPPEDAPAWLVEAMRKAA